MPFVFCPIYNYLKEKKFREEYVNQLKKISRGTNNLLPLFLGLILHSINNSQFETQKVT